MRQLMAQGNPPVNQGIRPAPLLDLRQVQVLKVPITEEEAPLPVESDGASVVVIEDMQTAERQSEDVTAVDEDGREVVEGGGVGAHEGVFVGEVVGEEDLHAAAGGGVEGEVLAGSLVAVGVCFFDFVGLWVAPDG